MYHTYTTRAFVIEQYGVGEADMLCELYTEDFGLIRAKAQGLRNEVSKLRYSMQTHALCVVSLVRGHTQWRLVGALSLAAAPTTRSALFARIAKLTTRLVNGEEKDIQLFSILHEVHTLAHAQEVPQHTELLMVCKILIALGYVRKDLIPEGESIQSTMLESFMSAHRSDILKSVNDALQHSHL